MIKKFLYGSFVIAILIGLPAFLESEILIRSKLWVLVGIGILGSLFQPKYDALDKPRTDHDRGTALQIIWSIYLCQSIALIEAATIRYPKSFSYDWLSWVALFLMVGGLALRTWAVALLGRFFTWHIDLQESQGVIEKGPYRWIRHPSYTGAFLTYFFSTLFLHSWISACLSIVILTFAFARRIGHEENLLRTSLKGYDAYMNRTKAVIPYLL